MTIDEQMQKSNEFREKCIEAISEGNMGRCLKAISVPASLIPAMQKEFHIEISGKMMELNCNKIQMALACYEMMVQMGDFFEGLQYVYSVAEIFNLGIIQDTGTTYDCESKEQRALMKELLKKSPEEIEKLKEEIKK